MPSISNAMFSDLGGGVSDLFAAGADRARAKGSEFEKQNYLLAAGLADQNAQFTETSTAIKEMQQQRALTNALGETSADVAANGFAASGSALDILRDSASQGALTKAVVQQQGLITEQGYKEQGQSFRNLAAAAQVAIDADNKAAEGAGITGIIKGVAAIASLLPGVGPVAAIVGQAASSVVGDPTGIGGLY